MDNCRIGTTIATRGRAEDADGITGEQRGHRKHHGRRGQWSTSRRHVQANRVDGTYDALADDPGIDEIFTGTRRADVGLDHPRAGDIILLSEDDRWFAHDWWTKDADAPDYQRTVDIHRKPGYDPRELFMTSPWRAAAKLAARKLGFRALSKACEDRAFDVLALKVDPRFEPLKDDPRLQAILRDVGLA